MVFDPRNYYWYIGGDVNNVYGSFTNTYPASTDSDYQAWVQSGNKTLPAADEAEIWFALKEFMPSWLWNGSTMSQPAVGEYTTTQLKAYAQLVRGNTADGGMTAEGIPILTDDFTRTRISNARTAAEADPQYTTTILSSDGFLHSVNATQVIAISDDVIAFGTNLAGTYATVHNEIDSGLITTLAAIDSAFAGVSRTVKDGSKNHYRGA
jgi:hypothetical protein